ncbi:MAG: hypothetical protein ABEI53_02670 [Candidatus Magasanikbacteria bacterium]
MPDNNSKKEELTWEAPEYQHFQKGFGWYAITILSTLTLLIFAFLRGNFFFAVFIVFAGAVVLFLGNKEPRVLQFEIDEEGIKIGNDMSYDYDDLEGFDIIEHPHKRNELILERNSTIDPLIKMPLKEDIEKEVQEKLNNHLERNEYDDSTIDAISDALKF